jgi:hypothetical protein
LYSTALAEIPSPKGGTSARGRDRDQCEREADHDHAGEARKDRRDYEQRDRERHRAEHHLLLVLALAPERLLALALPIRELLFDPVDEGLDQGRLRLFAELLARLDRRAQFVPRHQPFAHDSIVAISRGAVDLVDELEDSVRRVESGELPLAEVVELKRFQSFAFEHGLGRV